MIGLRRSLRHWPWDLPWHKYRALQIVGGPVDRRLGWPFDRLGPEFPERIIGVRGRDGVLASLLAGWWLYALSSLFTDPDARFYLPYMILAYLTTFGPAIRLFRYAKGYAPPIGLWGRIVTLRWLMPSYDQILVTPAVALV